MYLIAGLGNPGRKYQFTRHNLGFRVIETLAQNHQIPLNQKKFQSVFGQGIIEGQKVHLILPQTYMNLSGVAVGLGSLFSQQPRAVGGASGTFDSFPHPQLRIYPD